MNPEASHALPGAVFHLSKMRAHVAADARVTSGALYLQGPRRVFRGLGLGFQGLEFNEIRLKTTIFTKCFDWLPYAIRFENPFKRISVRSDVSVGFG